jgi:hypothetical protein
VGHRWLRRDLVIVLILGAIAAYGSHEGGGQIDPITLEPVAVNVWFNGDMPLDYAALTDREFERSRGVHPIFKMTFVPVLAIRKVAGLSPIAAVRAFYAAVAAIWAGLLFLLLRTAGLRPLDATIFTILGLSSASAVFWLTVPETYPLGSVTILVAFVALAYGETRRLPSAAYVGVSAATLSITLTNWMAGLLSAFVNQPWRRAVLVSASGFALVLTLWGVQKLIFPNVPLSPSTSHETIFFLPPDAGGPLRILAAFFYHSMVMPAIFTVPDLFNTPFPVMTTQQSNPGSAGVLGMIAVSAWLALLFVAVWALVRVKRNPRLRLAVALMLGGQLVLHLLYGDETFLYSLHFMPLLILAAAHGALTALRPVVLSIAGVVLITSGVNNIAQFNNATDFLREIETASPGRTLR